MGRDRNPRVPTTSTILPRLFLFAFTDPSMILFAMPSVARARTSSSAVPDADGDVHHALALVTHAELDALLARCVEHGLAATARLCTHCLDEAVYARRLLLADTAPRGVPSPRVALPCNHTHPFCAHVLLLMLTIPVLLCSVQ